MCLCVMGVGFFWTRLLRTTTHACNPCVTQQIHSFWHVYSFLFVLFFSIFLYTSTPYHDSCVTLMYETTDVYCHLSDSMNGSRESGAMPSSSHISCQTLQHSATRCNTLQHSATHCNTLQHPATASLSLARTRAAPCLCVWTSYFRHCNTLQHPATPCPATHISFQTHVHTFVGRGAARKKARHVSYQTLQHTATSCNTMQHTATPCNTLQHTSHSRRMCIHSLVGVLRGKQCGTFQNWGSFPRKECCSVSHVLQCVAVCCSVLQCVAVCCSVLQCVACVAVCCSVLQCVAVCCSVLQCAAACELALFGRVHLFPNGQQNKISKCACQLSDKQFARFVGKFRAKEHEKQSINICISSSW